eukprot:810973-Pyramimonas_sp.AAC.1
MPRRLSVVVVVSSFVRSFVLEVHPSIIAADLWPKMRSMKQQDLYDISAYILYQNYVIPEKWGGGK